MNKVISWLALIVGTIALSVALVGGNTQPVAENLGQAGTRFPNGLSIGPGASGACIQLYATSSATAGKLVASSTSLVNGVSTGVMLFSYGTCL